MGPYYYDFGRLLVNLADHDSSQTIAKILLWVNKYKFKFLLGDLLRWPFSYQ
jgi:hypothetical protein